MAETPGRFNPEPLSWLYQPSDGGLNSSARRYRGFGPNRAVRTLRPSRPVKLELASGDLLQLRNCDGATPVLLCPVNEAGESDFAAIGLDSNSLVKLCHLAVPDSANSTSAGIAEIVAWHQNLGGADKTSRLEAAQIFDFDTPTDELFAIRAIGTVTLWLLVHPDCILSDKRLLTGGMGGAITFEHVGLYSRAGRVYSGHRC